jgi:hypothetical protein
LHSIHAEQSEDSVSADKDYDDITEDISLLRSEVEKYSASGGVVTTLSKTIYEAGFQLKKRLDKGKFDEDEFRAKRKQSLKEIDLILAELKEKIKN